MAYGGGIGGSLVGKLPRLGGGGGGGGPPPGWPGRPPPLGGGGGAPPVTQPGMGGGMLANSQPAPGGWLRLMYGSGLDRGGGGGGAGLGGGAGGMGIRVPVAPGSMAQFENIRIPGGGAPPPQGGGPPPGWPGNQPGPTQPPINQLPFDKGGEGELMQLMKLLWGG